MVKITIDKKLKEKLFSSGEIVELRDESGEFLGRLFPRMDDPMKGWKPIGPELSEEELKRLSEYDGPGITTQELIARLRNKS